MAESIYRCDYQIHQATNGYTFTHYDVAKDEVTTTVAHSAEEMAKIITDWHAERLSGWVTAMTAPKVVVRMI
jgi:hypothetical protein